MSSQIKRLTSDTILNVSHLHYSIEDTPILNDFSFSIPAGSFCCLLGVSGCGKTSLLKLIAGLINPNFGDIEVDNRFVVKNGESVISVDQRRVGLVFQDYGLFPHLSIRDNVLFGLPKCSRIEQDEVVQRLLSLVNLQGFANRFPHELSGGQQQRVALARTIAPDPFLVLLDEPFSNVDQSQRYQLANDVKTILKEQAVSVLMVTHDQEEALKLADYVGIIYDNKLIQWDTPENIYFKPKTEKVAEFIGSGRWFNAKLVNTNKIVTSFGCLILSKEEIQGLAEKGLVKGSSCRIFLRDENFHVHSYSKQKELFKDLKQDDFRGIPFVDKWKVTEKTFGGFLTYLTLKPCSEITNNHTISVRVFVRSSWKVALNDLVYLSLNVDKAIVF